MSKSTEINKLAETLLHVISNKTSGHLFKDLLEEEKAFRLCIFFKEVNPQPFFIYRNQSTIDKLKN